MQEAGTARTAVRGAWAGILSNVVLAGVKMAVGVTARSQAVVADGLNNLTDVLGSLAVLIGVQVARRPADAEHRYGHERAETLAAFFVAGLMGAVALEVTVSAVQSLAAGGTSAPGLAAVAVSGGSVIIKEALYRWKSALATRLGSAALRAGAWDDRADALASLAALAGTVGGRAGVPWLDPVAGLAVAGFILRAAWRLGVEGAHTLMDGFSSARLAEIRHRVAACGGVRAVHDVRARHHGERVLVDVTIGVERTLTVAEGHTVAEGVERELAGHLGIVGVMVHVEPDG